MPELVLSPRDTEDGRRLAEAARAAGWAVHRLEGWRAPAGWTPEPDLALYGEPLFCRVLAAQLGRVLLEPNHDWLARLPAWATRRRVRCIRLGDVPSEAFPVFLKPPDDKLFPARVYDGPEPFLARPDLPPDEPVIASEPVRFATEHRVHLLDGAAVACSRYSVGGALSVDAADPDRAEAMAFAAKVAQADPVPPAVVVDVGRLEDGSWAVVEANPAFGAGIDAAAPLPVLDVLRSACRPQAGLPKALAAFTYPVLLE